MKKGEILDKIEAKTPAKVSQHDADGGSEQYNRFYDPEVEFKRLIEKNKVIRQGDEVREEKKFGECLKT
jgi:hypothetical protein